MSVAISFVSHSLIGILLKPFSSDSLEKFKNYLSQIKNEKEKDAICFLTIGIGNSACSIPALEHLMNRYDIQTVNSIQFLPEDVISSFWEYLAVLVQSQRLLYQYIHFFVDFLPLSVSPKTVEIIMKLSNDNCYLINSYVKKLSADNINNFIPIFFEHAAPSHIQSVVPILVSMSSQVFSILIRNFNPTDIMSEYALSLALSYTNSLKMVDSDYEKLVFLFLSGVVKTNSPLFANFCLYTIRYVVDLEYRDINDENTADYVFSNILKGKPILKQELADKLAEYVSTLDPAMKINLPRFTIIVFSDVNNEKLIKYFAVQFLSLKNPWPIVSNCFSRAFEKKSKSLKILSFSVLALFLRTQPTDKHFGSAAECMKKLNNTEFPLDLPYYVKLIDIFSDNSTSKMAFELASKIRTKVSEVLVKLFKVFDSCSNDIDAIIELLLTKPGQSITALYAFASSVNFSTVNERKECLIKIINTFLTKAEENQVPFKKLYNEKTMPKISTYAEMKDFLNLRCGHENQYAIYNDAKAIDEIQNFKSSKTFGFSFLKK